MILLIAFSIGFFHSIKGFEEIGKVGMIACNTMMFLSFFFWLTGIAYFHELKVGNTPCSIVLSVIAYVVGFNVLSEFKNKTSIK